MTTPLHARLATTRRRGGALVPCLILVVALAGIAASVFGVSNMRNSEARRTGQQMRALYIAEAGLSDALMTIAVAEREDDDVPGSIGSYGAPVKYQKGSYWCEVVGNADDSYTVRSHGSSGGAQRALEVVIEPLGKSVFDHAIFAGNSSGDPTYVMKLTGIGIEADRVEGDIYSGNDVLVKDDAAVTGVIDAWGSVTGAVGNENVKRPIPDIAGMAYDANHDVNVGAIFAAQKTWAYDSLGGSAYQVPEESPAHIFRLNPNDRSSETSGTAKDDYFLEDPYEDVRNYTAWYSGSSGHTVTLSGVDGEPGTSGNDSVYFIDGNLWVHNKRWKNMRFNRGDDPTKITFIVKGNVYFSDDATVMDHDSDGMAFIAIKDENEADSGNIYMGDPRFGTVERIESFLYAENDFIDYNLDEDGSKYVTLAGNMTAGNRVAIERDFVQADGSSVHSKLTVEFDDRLSTGALELPGIPKTLGGVEGYGIVLWREIGIQ